MSEGLSELVARARRSRRDDAGEAAISVASTIDNVEGQVAFLLAYLNDEVRTVARYSADVAKLMAETSRLNRDVNILSFVPFRGAEFAFLGVHLVGAIRPLAGAASSTRAPHEWTFYLDAVATRRATSWRTAGDRDLARAAISRRAADWYDAAHTRVALGQAERLVAEARIG